MNILTLINEVEQNGFLTKTLKIMAEVIIPPLFFFTLNMNKCTYIHTMQRILNYKT